jgi:ribosomal protein S18 acetylase RimI-like enzyme
MFIETGSNSIAMDGGRRVSFRPAAPEDESFLLEVYGSTRLEELALTNWDQHQRAAFLKMQLDAQHIHYRGQYPAAQYLIILLNEVRVGRLYMAETSDEVRILDITVVPQFRGAGIGSAIVRELMPMAAARGKPLGIYVESFNRSLGLFERLGFVKSGENGYSFLMRWSGESEAGGQVSGAGGTA